MRTAFLSQASKMQRLQRKEMSRKFSPLRCSFQRWHDSAGHALNRSFHPRAWRENTLARIRRTQKVSVFGTSLIIGRIAPRAADFQILWEALVKFPLRVDVKVSLFGIILSVGRRL
ncbi:MAG: hypothetical protein QOI13_1478 [Paraburkholderia sp.]|nr:hypothetical protein [Paraburkholderia sp.]